MDKSTLICWKAVGGCNIFFAGQGENSHRGSNLDKKLSTFLALIQVIQD
ncbi:hypothetical protein [Vescimonas sp.]|jgi:hypothetical protein